MSEIILNIEGVEPIEFFGENNIKLTLLKNAFPEISFTARGSQLKLIGVVFGIIAILAIILGQAVEKATQGLNLKSALFLFCVWAGYAAVDILLKYSSSLGLQFAVTLNLTFIMAFVLFYWICQAGKVSKCDLGIDKSRME